MPHFEVYFEYVEPAYGVLKFEAEDKKEAELEALDHIERAYPEAIDIEITEVTEHKNA